MAQLVLSAVGTALGGPLGAIAGSLIGGFIDSALGLNGNVEGPRLNDLSVTASTYGQAIPLIYGPENRLGGNIIWSSGLIEKKKKKRGGKGGGPSVTTYSYSVSLAVALGEGPIGSVPRIWANGKKIFDVADAISTPTPGAAGEMVWTTANKAHGVAETITIYLGNGAQNPDPTIESYLGAGNAPAYRHTAYLVIKKLQLADFGNAIPNLQFEVAGGGSAQVAAWVMDIGARAGVADVVVSGVTDTGRGFVVGRESTAVAALEPLALAYGFDVSEQRGQIRCVKRGLAIKATIPIEDLGAVEVSAGKDGAYAEPVRYERMPPMQLPRAAAVSHVDPAIDYQVNTQRASRQQGNADSNITHELPVTLTVDEARALADRILWEAWTSRRAAKFQVNDRWIGLNPGDVVGLPAAGRVVPFRLLRATRGANGVIDMEARHDDPEVYSSVMAGAAGYLPANPLELPGETRLVLMDAPLLRAGDDNDGFYWAVSQTAAGWRGAEILRSSDGGIAYQAMSPVAVDTAIGDVAAALPAGPVDYWDRGNSITVVLAYAGDDLLESKSEIEVLNGANAAWLGSADGQDGEIIQFQTATLVSPGTYELSNLLRGRMGTDHAVGGHGTNEVFVLLDNDSLGRTDYGAGDWYKARLFKPVSVLTAEADTASQSFTNEGEGKRPLSPVHVTGARDGSNNLTIGWTRRSRLFQPGLGYGDPPLGEEVEAYEVDIIVGGVAVRTIAAATESAAYSAANQTSDGITPGNPVTVDVYQLSVSRGRGHARRAVI